MDFKNSYSKKLTLPVYKPCNNNNTAKKTSAEIIREAREQIIKGNLTSNNEKLPPSDSSTSVIKPVNTQRPFTPKDSQRILFGRNSKAARPPSSFSLRYLQFENSDVVPSTPLKPPDVVDPIKDVQKQKKQSEIFQVATADIPLAKIKLPSIDACFKPFNKFPFRSTNSLEKLPEEHENIIETPKPARRNAYSSPNETTEYTSSTSITNSNGITVKKTSHTDALILEPRNLDNIFSNKQIIYDSANLFTKRRFDSYPNNPKAPSAATNLLFDEFNNSYASINEILNKLSDLTITCDELIKYLRLLYDCLKLEGYISGGKKVGSKLKLSILKCLYKYVESNNEKILLNIARIILAIKVTGSNLVGVCKLVFKISRDDRNDSLFLEDNTLDLFLESLGSASPIEDTEALIYGYGAIKFLTMNTRLLKVILEQGILQLIVLHIKIINNTRIEKVQAPEQLNHVLFQITGALRNLANHENIYDAFVTSGAVSELCSSTELFTTDVDIISNISRILSVISTDEHCCEIIADFDNIFVVFVQLFEKYPGKQDMIVRLGYTLGNLVARFDYSRYKFYNARNSMSSLINIIKIYTTKDLKIIENNNLTSDSESYNNSKDQGSTGSIEDVIIKMIRIIANISMNSDVGHELLTMYGAGLIDIFITLLQRKTVKESDELILSILSTLNNLSYYFTTDIEVNVFYRKQADLCTELCKVLNSENTECITEAIRVLGNLTRSKISREFIIENNTVEKLISFLDKEDLDLLKTTIGVFINMMADDTTRMIFKTERGITKLIKLLSQYGEIDWSLSTLICQVIWNYCIDTTNICFIIDEFDVNQLLGLLADYLDEERIFGITEDNATDISDILTSEDYILWEEFATVGTNLLEKIENFLDNNSLEMLDCRNTTPNDDDDDVYIPLEMNSKT